jgi:predicted P-loop ATPase
VEGLANVGPILDDRALEQMWLLIDEQFGFRPTKDFFWTVVSVEARRNGFHPILDYLGRLRWDEVPRLDNWLHAHGGADDTPYVRAVGALLLTAAVRRVRQPGCKFDEMVVLESPQGTNKSSALALLAVQEDWFSDDLPLHGDSKRKIEALQGHWIVEVAELQGMRRSDVDELKAFLSRRVDRARMSYDRTVTEIPRQCVIVGTTNAHQYLKDETGNRRFWPVRVAGFDLAALARDRDQLWAEAVVREAPGDPIRLDPALWAAAAEQQDQRLIEDPYLNALAPALGERTGKIKSADVFALLQLLPGHRTQEQNRRVGQAMTKLGWTRTKLRFKGAPEWCYTRGDTRDTLHVDPEIRTVQAARPEPTPEMI